MDHPEQSSSSSATGNTAALPLSRDWLRSCRADRELTDVNLVCEGAVMPAHRFVLAYQSPVFRAMLYGSYREANDDDITVEITGAATLERLLEAMYSHDYNDGLPCDAVMSPARQSITLDTLSTWAGPRSGAGVVDTSQAQVDAVMASVANNICVFAAADYYQVAHVLELATAKFTQMLVIWIMFTGNAGYALKPGMLHVATTIRDLIPQQTCAPLLRAFITAMCHTFAHLKKEERCIHDIAAVRQDFATGIIDSLDRSAADARARAHALRTALDRENFHQSMVQWAIRNFDTDAPCPLCALPRRHRLAYDAGVLRLVCTFCSTTH